MKAKTTETPSTLAADIESGRACIETEAGGLTALAAALDERFAAAVEAIDAMRERTARFNALKEATHVSRGSAKPVMAMSRAARENLWRSVVEGDRALARELLERGARAAA